MTDEPTTAQATFCATLVDEWVRAGAAHAVVSPGSRSTPLALALAARDEIDVHVVLDERSAAFVALGLGRATGRPTVLLCTSGTAAANLHPAVVEARLSGIPLLVCTADRPPELQDVGAPQTIDQDRLYGRSPRWYASVPPADATQAWTWRSIAARAAAEAADGPVHLNLGFRDPLVGSPGPLPPGRASGRPWHHVERRSAVGGPGAASVGGRGLVVAGAGADPAVADLADVLGWPVLADPLSGLRVPGAVAAADALCRVESWAEAHRPEVVVHSGRPWASRLLGAWLAASGAEHVLVDPVGRWADPERVSSVVVPDVPSPGRPAPEGWRRAWSAAEQAAQQAITDALAAFPGVTEPGLARRLADAVPDGGALVVSSSMPVRDLEWYGRPRTGVRFHANRGANGIDGVTSTALGVALADRRRPTACLIGDLALLHDLSGLSAVAAAGVPLTLVVPDNGGGGIFSFLPQASALDGSTFEALFGTPHGHDLLAVAAALRIPATEVRRLDDVRVGSDGPRLLLARTDRAHNVEVHAAVHAAVVAAVGALA